MDSGCSLRRVANEACIDDKLPFCSSAGSCGQKEPHTYTPPAGSPHGPYAIASRSSRQPPMHVVSGAVDPPILCSWPQCPKMQVLYTKIVRAVSADKCYSAACRQPALRCCLAVDFAADVSQAEGCSVPTCEGGPSDQQDEGNAHRDLPCLPDGQGGGGTI